MIIRHTGVGNKIVNYLLSGNSVFKRHAWQGKFLYQFVIGSISTKHGQKMKSVDTDSTYLVCVLMIVRIFAFLSASASELVSVLGEFGLRRVSILTVLRKIMIIASSTTLAIAITHYY